jgi:ABC-2 type transport system permease protein
MDKIMAIFKKEVKGFFFNPNFLVVCALCSVILSWIYPIQLNMFANELRNFVYQSQTPKQQLNIHYAVFLRHLSYLNLMLILIVPALTMRLFAEEKKMHTFDLLLTSPVSSLQIVIGKYWATLAAILTIILIALMYPVMTSFFVKVNWVTLCISFFGIFLVSAVYGAMDLFCSSLSESAIVSYVMAVLFNVAIWFVGIGGEVVDSSLGRKIFEHISLSQHLSSFVEGTIRSSTLVFFASLIFLFGFLTERVVESSRWR